MSKMVVIECPCKSPKCRIQGIRIDPEGRELWVELLNDNPKEPHHEALMYLDRKAFRALVSAGQRGLKRLLAQKR